RLAIVKPEQPAPMMQVVGRSFIRATVAATRGATRRGSTAADRGQCRVDRRLIDAAIEGRLDHGCGRRVVARDHGARVDVVDPTRYGFDGTVRLVGGDALGGQFVEENATHRRRRTFGAEV